MENYFAILDLAPTATPHQVRTRYHLLMQVYWPGRFANPLDISYAEHKRAELTQAYRALVETEEEVATDVADLSLPRVEPSLIDWGIVNQGNYLAAHVYIYPETPVKTLSVHRDAAATWINVSRPERVKVAGNLLLSFGVMVSTNQLEIGKSYINQIQVEINGLSLYVLLMMKIDRPFIYANHRQLPASELHLHCPRR